MNMSRSDENRPSRLLVVMGVAGSGKSSVGAAVAVRLGGTYFDGDDLHPRANIEKMSRGTALSDADRWPWLEEVARNLSSRSGLVLVGCSALKRSYRDFITAKAGERVTFIYLAGSRQLIARRMGARTGHFMPTSLLDSQFEALEVPGEDELKITIDISGTESEVVEQVISKLDVAATEAGHQGRPVITGCHL